MFNIQSPEDWEAFQEDYEERKRLLEEMAKYHVILVELEEGFYPIDIEKQLEPLEGVKYIADWEIKEDDPDIVGETLSYILKDEEVEG